MDFETKHNDCSFVICKDMNAGTRESPNYLIDNYLHYVPLPEDYVFHEDFLPRYLLDKNSSNSNGQMSLDFWKQTSLRIVNGRFGSDKMVGNFTGTTSRGKSLVDYVLVSKSMLSKIESFDVGGPNILSDHHLISFSLDTCANLENPVNDTEKHMTTVIISTGGIPERMRISLSN